jgi:flagellar hook protein FlgE
MDPLSTARYGMMAAENRLAASASRIANWNGDDSVDLAQETVEQVKAKQQFVACAHVVHVADEMWDALMKIQSD